MTKASIAIRPLEEKDRPEWSELWRAYLAFYETEKPQAIYDVTWARLMTPGEDPRGFCAVDEAGRLVGIVHYIFHRSCWTVGPYCYLQDLYADPSARGAGVGRALIEAVYRAADEAGADVVYWLTQDFNATARRLYDRIGKATPFIKYVR
ncbi:GNAT family N-acetyltransferase [Polymorphum gilvum]|uniref:N-acetyltransferase HPA3 n=1 Tax=Polymorphum gilvum (strain LMG 25793 / CGMCC 1.9160 / SL003B-26A1) TaxID=991905 RepID=F2IV02_POLGS|nr:GNAT family N-acetyltransferase [Polymorphum gilvum]ADZ70231.1 N-acetyltransferase HPA3 [Polymorphum gilvum SL003B-26A1]